MLAFYDRVLLRSTPETPIAILGGLPPFFVLLFSSLVGRVLDAGHYHRVHILSSLFLCGGLLGLSFTGRVDSSGDVIDSSSFWKVFPCAIAMGIGQSGFFVTPSKVIALWYPQNKGVFVGLSNAGPAIGKDVPSLILLS